MVNKSLGRLICSCHSEARLLALISWQFLQGGVIRKTGNTEMEKRLSSPSCNVA